MKRKMRCPEGHTFDGAKFGRCPVCDGTLIAPPSCDTCQINDLQGFDCGQEKSCGQGTADGPVYHCDLYLAPGAEACGVCSKKGGCASLIGPKDATCPGFWFVGWDAAKQDDAPETDVPLRERKIKALLGTIGELETTESEKKTLNSNYNSKITDLKESIIRLSREINEIDHPAPMPLFDGDSAVATKAMENPKLEDDGPKDGIIVPDEDGGL